MDGDVLVVNSISRTGPDAVAELQALGIGNGSYGQQASVSIAQFDRLCAEIAADQILAPLVASVGLTARPRSSSS
jgi:hypothetical protein